MKENFLQYFCMSILGLFQAILGLLFDIKTIFQSFRSITHPLFLAKM